MSNTSNDDLDVKGKHCLFIGDSHTCNDNFGYQKLMCDYTGMTYDVCAKSGCTTKWMLDYGFLHLANQDKYYDYCFIWGGANDAYNSVNEEYTLMNLRSLIKLCNKRNIKCVVITGFDPFTCVRDNKKVAIMNYKVRYNHLQNKMLTELTNCKVVDTRQAIKQKDCGDWLCHMKYSGHKEMAMTLIKDLNFKLLP